MAKDWNDQLIEEKMDALRQEIQCLRSRIDEFQLQIRAPQLIANDLAMQIALAEMIRFAIGEITFDQDPEKARVKLQITEESLISSLGSRNLWANADPQADTMIKEAACAFITTVLTSLRHPKDHIS